MAKALLIAEKPDLMRHIKEAYDLKGHPDTLSFKSFIGHTMGLIMPGDYKPEWQARDMSQLPMIPDTFIYKATKDKVKVYKELKTEVLSGKYDYIINACDPGREGQHIFWSFYDSTGCKLPVKRIWHADLTVDELTRALNNLLDEKSPRLANMTQASKLRAQFDWLVGMNFSTGFSLAANKNISVGRVMTPTLKIVVDRELEIQNFVSKPFWMVEGDFVKYLGMYDEQDNGGKFNKKADAQAFIKGLGTQGVVTFVESSKQTKKAPPLFSLQLLSTEASKEFGYSMSETLKITQGLYERKLVSYPRTDSCHLTSAISDEFMKMLKPIALIPELKATAEAVMKDAAVLTKISKDKTYVDDKKVSDHYAITPTKMKPNLSQLSEKERNIYTLIAKRFLAIFLPPLVTNKTKIITTVDGKHDFVSNGSVLVSKGFMELYKYNPKDQELPVVKKGAVLPVKGMKLVEKKTSAPVRYTDGTLGMAMENAGRFVADTSMKAVLKESKGIGTPATRGSIVDKLVTRNMIGYQKKALYATEYGISLIQALNNHGVTSVEMTAEWEGKLQAIEEGTLTATAFYTDMVAYITQASLAIKGMHMTVKGSAYTTTTKKGGKSVGEVIGVCPKCGGEVKVGKAFYLCENYKDSCEFIVGEEQWGAKVSKTEVVKILEGKETKVFDFKKGDKEWKARLAYDKAEGKVKMVFENDGKGKSSAGKAVFQLTDGTDVFENNYYFHNDVAGLKISKHIWGVDISKEDVQALWNGETLPSRTFTWKSGKSSDAKLVYDRATQKTNFLFD